MTNFDSSIISKRTLLVVLCVNLISAVYISEPNSNCVQIDELNEKRGFLGHDLGTPRWPPWWNYLTNMFIWARFLYKNQLFNPCSKCLQEYKSLIVCDPNRKPSFFEKEKPRTEPEPISPDACHTAVLPKRAENDLMNTTSLNQAQHSKADYDVRQDAPFSARRDVIPMQWPTIFSSNYPPRQIRSDPYIASAPRSNIDPVAVEVTQKQAELQQLLQQIYQAEADVQMQAGEVTRIQQSAAEAIQQLEDATNKARMLSADLQAAQDEAASAAMRAHTAQLQLAAHDHLMFAARQRVDSLSAQMLSAQAELATVQQVFTLNATTHHLEDQGKISVAFNIPPYGQVFTNSGQLAPEPLSLGPESIPALTNFETSNSLKSSGSEMSPLSGLNASPDYFNAAGGRDGGVDFQRRLFPRDKPLQKLGVEYPIRAKQQYLRRQTLDPLQQPTSINLDPTLQEDSKSFISELQKQSYDASVTAQP